jgi:Raf kinase inhibitor-like YbhB/YbcL family protein
MKIEVKGLTSGQRVPDQFCFMVPDPQSTAKMGPNVSPEIRWSDVPAGTRSLALIVQDPDAPTDATNVNREGTSLPESMPRGDFHHWVLIDIPPGLGSIAEGLEAKGIEARGKELGEKPYGVRGENDYSNWFAGDEQMAGVYGGYDGPAPPMNDLRLHHYHFRLYALDVESLGLSGRFDAAAAKKAMEGHILAETEVVGTYSLNPEVNR